MPDMEQETEGKNFMYVCLFYVSVVAVFFFY